MSGETISAAAIDAAHRVLSDRRRRRVIEKLDEAGQTATIDDLAEWVAKSDRADGDRGKLAMTLYHTHLPMMEEADVIEYDATTNTVTLTEHGERVAALRRVTADSLGDRSVECP